VLLTHASSHPDGRGRDEAHHERRWIVGFSEIKGNLWKLAEVFDVHAVCITTNGVVKNNGACVMGKGCAKEARDRFPDIDRQLGDAIAANGNVVQVVQEIPIRVVAFPVKHHWRDIASLQLIRQSCVGLMELIEKRGWTKVLLPRPGCGNGRLDWERQVKPILKEELDHRVAVITHADPDKGQA